MQTEDRVAAFREMVLTCHNLYVWTLTENLGLIDSSCPEQELVQSLLAIRQSRGELLVYAENHDKPLLMTNPLGLMWAAIPALKDSYDKRIYVLGPFFTQDRSIEDILAAIRAQGLTDALARPVESFLRSLPVITLGRIFEYTIMLYYCITGEKISVSDIHYEESERRQTRPSANAKQATVHGTYEIEREMVRLVREGNLDYLQQMDRLAVTGSMGTLSNGDPERQMKNAVIVCIVLFSRASIEGGLSPEIALTLSDRYFQSVEACHSIPELAEVARTMQDDYVRRVHRIRTSQLSQPIRECCDYLSLHLTEDLTMRGMAQRLGYSESYFSRKFKQETGAAFKDYLLSRRLERAEDLLRNSALSVHQISEQLRFCSQSYFAEQFRALYGVSPSAWRRTQENAKKQA